MSISKMIIFSSTLVALLAAFAGYTAYHHFYRLELGILEVIPKQELVASVDQLRTVIMWTCGITAILAIGFGQFIAWHLRSSMNRLHAVADKIEKGQFDEKVDINANNEIGGLGRRLDNMTNYLSQAKLVQEQQVELKKLNQALKLKNASLDSFVYRVSHDLKAPIINIKTLFGVIKSKSCADDQIIQQSLTMGLKAASQLENTITDLLEISRIENRVNEAKEWVDLSQLLESIELENFQTIQNTSAEIEFDFFTIDQLYFSPANLKSILSNLIDNALKYKHPDRSPRIQLATSMKNEKACLVIKDNGIGIDLEKHEKKLFGMFNRFHDHVEGSGVGLYIVKQIIESSGGQIKIESHPNEGTTFYLYFYHPSLELAEA